MVFTKSESPGDVQEQSFTSALKKPVPKIFTNFQKKISLSEFLFVKLLA